MTIDEFIDQLPPTGELETREAWLRALDEARALARKVDAAERAFARSVIGDTLIEYGARHGWEEPAAAEAELG